MPDDVVAPPDVLDGVVDVPMDSEGGTTMADEAEVRGDIADDVMDLQLDGFLKTTEFLVAEGIGNIQSADSIMRNGASGKFVREDPIEAACAEKILK